MNDNKKVTLPDIYAVRIAGETPQEYQKRLREQREKQLLDALAQLAEFGALKSQESPADAWERGQQEMQRYNQTGEYVPLRPYIPPSVPDNP